MRSWKKILMKNAKTQINPSNRNTSCIAVAHPILAPPAKANKLDHIYSDKIELDQDS